MRLMVMDGEQWKVVQQDTNASVLFLDVEF